MDDSSSPICTYFCAAKNNLFYENFSRHLHPTYFDTYISQVADLDLFEALQQSLAVIDTLDLDKLHALGDRVYALGKWTIRVLFQHVSIERSVEYGSMKCNF